jgi:hypothetical protein
MDDKMDIMQKSMQRLSETKYESPVTNTQKVWNAHIDVSRDYEKTNDLMRRVNEGMNRAYDLAKN